MLKCSVWLLYDKIWYCITWFKKSAKNKNGFKDPVTRFLVSSCMIKYHNLWYHSTAKKTGLKAIFDFVRTLFVCSYFVRFSWLLASGPRNSTRVFLKKFKIKKSFLKKEVWHCSILLEWLKNIVKPVHSSVFSSVDSVPSL